MAPAQPAFQGQGVGEDLFDVLFGDFRLLPQGLQANRGTPEFPQVARPRIARQGLGRLLAKKRRLCGRINGPEEFAEHDRNVGLAVGQAGD